MELRRPPTPPRHFVGGGRRAAPLARFPLAWNHASDKKARRVKKLERILIAKVYQLLRNAL
ncbi:hypothetical protein MJC1_02449 [Methylocystis sp. MJC1]|jgi:hypothetical protein|nr:hypothetical protein MJC1_02449 [Methylocystis sp. MJC1]